MLYLDPAFTCKPRAEGQWCTVDQQFIHFRVPTKPNVVYAHDVEIDWDKKYSMCKVVNCGGCLNFQYSTFRFCFVVIIYVSVSTHSHMPFLDLLVESHISMYCQENRINGNMKGFVWH